ncbi:hypothetical protein SAMN05216304_11616 [Bosea sp. OK403]|uniref:hypothetical protein n=1 Tax=Bosea sp. OK403 TaxID=1855286 RepID=UPI0008E65787|nr:hypothetical protein [Bosea sp. OK403]SFJ83295.1 hypothetical protein SAMN05216304_11616 [Bosea sp. OK403]
MDGKCIRLDLEEADATERHLVQVEDLPGSFAIVERVGGIDVIQSDGNNLSFKARIGSDPNVEMMTTIFRCSDYAYVVESDGARFIDG